jgi:dephospho-CoA kinase
MEIKKQKKQVTIRFTTTELEEILKDHIKKTKNININSVKFNIGKDYEYDDWKRLNPIYVLSDIVCKGFDDNEKLRMKKIGITGGIGSGKSFVCNIFKCFGIPIFNSDEIAKYLTETDVDVKNKIKETFGNDIYLPIGVLDRKRLADVVFNDKEKLSQLNNIVHPAVRNYFERWILFQNNPPYVITENAILFESGQSDFFDKIITVNADEEIRIKRVMVRNSISRDKVLERMNNQLSNDYKLEHSDYVILNNENAIEASFLNLIPQVYEIHSQLCDTKF